MKRTREVIPNFKPKPPQSSIPLEPVVPIDEYTYMIGNITFKKLKPKESILYGGVFSCGEKGCTMIG